MTVSVSLVCWFISMCNEQERKQAPVIAKAITGGNGTWMGWDWGDLE